MGISLHAYPVSDSQLDAFQRDPAALTAWLPPFDAGGAPGVTLFSYWRDLNQILTQVVGTANLPWSVLVEGELLFPAAADMGAHAVRSLTARALGDALAAITEQHLDQYGRACWKRLSLHRGENPVPTPPQLASITSDYRSALRSLVHVQCLAAASGQGLFFSRWEDF